MNARCIAAVYLQTKRLSMTSPARSSGAAGGEASPELFSVKHPPGPGAAAARPRPVPARVCARVVFI